MAYTYRHGDRPIEGYTIQRAVGRGGFGEVYYAVSDGGKDVALKYLRDNPEIELRGVEACLNLKSPHLVSLHDVRKNADGEYFIVMEYISGPSLRDLLVAEPGGLGTERALFFLREIGKGLSYLHDRGIVHRDLKPGNIFYDDGYVKIGDYGLSKFISVSRHSAQTSSVGTVHYMAPEVGSGHYSRGIDIYALGVMFYEMLLGKVPFEGSSMGEVLMKHLTARPELDDLPGSLAQVIRRALEKDPADRYQTVDEMVLEACGSAALGDASAFRPEMSLSGVAKAAVAAPGLDPGVPAHPPAARKPVGMPPPPPPPPRTPRTPVDAGIGRGQGAQADQWERFESPPPRGDGGPGFAPIARALAPEVVRGELVYAGFWIRVVAALIDVTIIGIVAMGTPPGAFALGIVYQGFLMGLWEGQTVGKKVCGIKVINGDGTHLTVPQAFIRALAKIVSTMTMGIGYVMAAFDGRKRALHDRIARTLHIYSWPAAPAGSVNR